ncbi:hypothetical protein [Rhodobacter lacus]|uniref:Uncharacterized protein n=1 Tax=Rhodobacter lacus TaxID=1641972 RepID=A0ABW5A4L6_9RHOB
MLHWIAFTVIGLVFILSYLRANATPGVLPPRRGGEGGSDIGGDGDGGGCGDGGDGGGD